MFRSYYRLTKPGIIYGNALTLIGGFLLASRGKVDVGLLLATLVGTSLVIAAGCVFNNYIDRDIDTLMLRTRERALVQGKISGPAAIAFGSALGVIGFAILITWTNWLTVAIGIVAIIDYVLLYGLAKRRSWHGTLVGTIAGSASIVAGYTAVSGHLNTAALLLFLIMATWQMAHFYAIAMYRHKDYQLAGIPVISVAKSMRTAKLHIMVYIIAFMIVTALLTVSGYTGVIFAICMTSIGLLWFSRGLEYYHQPDDERWGRRMFRISLIVLLVLSVMLSVGSQLP